MIHIPEPQLEFRFGQTVAYPRDGLFLFGPLDAADQPRQVRYGVIGTSASLRRFKEWAAMVSRFINVPPPGRMSKAIEAHHVAFPGFSEVFFRPGRQSHGGRLLTSMSSSCYVPCESQTDTRRSKQPLMCLSSGSWLSAIGTRTHPVFGTLSFRSSSMTLVGRDPSLLGRNE